MLHHGFRRALPDAVNTARRAAQSRRSVRRGATRVHGATRRVRRVTHTGELRAGPLRAQTLTAREPWRGSGSRMHLVRMKITRVDVRALAIWCAHAPAQSFGTRVLRDRTLRRLRRSPHLGFVVETEAGPMSI